MNRDARITDVKVCGVLIITANVEWTNSKINKWNVIMVGDISQIEPARKVLTEELKGKYIDAPMIEEVLQKHGIDLDIQFWNCNEIDLT